MSGLGFTHWGALAAIAFGVSFCTIDYADYANAQITPDGTLPNNTSVTREGGTFNITGGTQAGGNLFHSFGEFSVNTGGTAFFDNGTGIQNIISRVTGGSVSNIDGIIRTLGTANLFLINPMTSLAMLLQAMVGIVNLNRFCIYIMPSRLAYHL
ncbi:Large exoprotein involved in heme utilization or adhesion [Nostoc flagelliforme CCNUN1]|uniref:Large exoprotein involved in heme utilization or adhesion n=1 Tax=Nostoc flagelliforme CCNUN1 TaxID=2038116 RepID=A0A2K8T3W3_9NOSO|nr:filamentous hemagglutinin N-terminal domain-containing protein [Nostoc flagelliforme]AUB41695.1 Large exoprotein involved in heme utilization or adhesion [Nostoc flagelliforme CCNUN1]